MPGNGNLCLCKVSLSNLVWLVSYACLIREEGEDEEFGKLLLSINTLNIGNILITLSMRIMTVLSRTTLGVDARNSTYAVCSKRQVNEKSFDLKQGIYGWYKKEGDKTGMNGCMLLW